MPEYILSRPLDLVEYVVMPSAPLEPVYGRVNGGDLEWVRGKFANTEIPAGPAPPVGGSVFPGTILNGNRNFEFDVDAVGWNVVEGDNYLAVWIKIVGELEHRESRSVSGLGMGGGGGEGPPVGGAPGHGGHGPPPGHGPRPGPGPAPPPQAAMAAKAIAPHRAAAVMAASAASSLPTSFELRLDRTYPSSTGDDAAALFNGRLEQAEAITLTPDLAASVPGTKLVYSAQRSTDHVADPEDPTTASRWVLEIPDPKPATPIWIAKVFLIQSTESSFDTYAWYKTRFDPTVEQHYISSTGSPYQVRIGPG